MRGKYKQPTEDELRQRNRGRREAEAEMRQLKERWPELRRSMSAEALAATWFLLGSQMFSQEHKNGQ